MMWAHELFNCYKKDWLPYSACSWLRCLLHLRDITQEISQLWQGGLMYRDGALHQVQERIEEVLVKRGVQNCFKRLRLKIVHY